MPRIHIPASLRPSTAQRRTVEVAGATVAEALRALVAGYPGLQAQLYDARGQLRRFVNVYVNDEDIRTLQADQTPLAPDDVITLIPSVAGGRA